MWRERPSAQTSHCSLCLLLYGAGFLTRPERSLAYLRSPSSEHASRCVICWCASALCLGRRFVTAVCTRLVPAQSCLPRHEWPARCLAIQRPPSARLSRTLLAARCVNIRTAGGVSALRRKRICPRRQLLGSGALAPPALSSIAYLRERGPEVAAVIASPTHSAYLPCLSPPNTTQGFSRESGKALCKLYEDEHDKLRGLVVRPPPVTPQPRCRIKTSPTCSASC